MRVFLDTNVLASAIATRGLCADLVRELLLSHELVVSEVVLDELARVLALKFGASARTVGEVQHLLRQDTTLAPAGELPEVVLDDADDLRVLASAVAGGAEVFVTGDKAVQTLRRVGEMDILSPRQFWERLTGGPLPAS